MKDKSQIALVTGGNKGIGFATAKLLLNLVYSVYIGARDQEKGLAAVQHLKALGYKKALLPVIDVADINPLRLRLKYFRQKPKNWMC
jgi:NAD(P)-dependent dehydrogenase (short-subunit alcohol dehydrogenase family)